MTGFETMRGVLESIPNAWDNVAPRVYKHADAFGDPAVASVAIGVALQANSDPRFNDESVRRCAEVSERLRSESIPTLFVARHLAESVMRSALPDEISWPEMRLPFEAAVVIPPRGLIRGPYGDVDFVAYRRYRADEIVITPERTIRSAKDTLVWFTAQRGDPHFAALQRTITSPPKPKLSEVLFSAEESFLLGTEYLEGEAERYVTTDDTELMDRLARFAFGSLLAITARPELRESGRHVGVHKKSGREIWTPNVLGAAYRTPSRASAGGEHASPRLHWRRGHFRAQRFGPGLGQTKIVWIEPVLVGV